MADRTDSTIRSDEECLDLLGGYALGILSPAEVAAVEAWLPTSPVCRDELRILRQGTDAYALAAEERDPSPELRNRLWASIRAEPRGQLASTPTTSQLPQLKKVPLSKGTPTPSPIRKTPIWGRLAAAIALLLAGAGMAWAVLSGDDDSTAVELGQFVVTDTAPAGTTTTGEVSYDADQNLMRLDLENLPALPEGYVYQLWLVTDDGQVLPSVVFGPQSGDTTSVAMVANPSGVDVLALTQEPGPIGSVSATTPIFAVADLDTSEVEAG